MFDRVLELTTPTFRDLRGEFCEMWSFDALPAYQWRRDNLSVSKKGVLRGIHGEPATTKLVSCISGVAYVVVVAPDKSAWRPYILTGANRRRLLVPPAYGLAYVALTDVIYTYKQDTDFEAAREFTWKWNDPNIGVRWPIDSPILSERDK